MGRIKYEKLSRDKEENTEIMGGHTKLTVAQLEKEMQSDSEIGKKLRDMEKILEENY
jgi:hypothetical protein